MNTKHALNMAHEKTNGRHYREERLMDKLDKKHGFRHPIDATYS